MKILITGGAGFIGSHTARALVERGDEVRILDALTQPVHEPGAEPPIADTAELIRGDVRSPDDWQRSLRGIDAVIHLGAYQDYLTDFSKFFEVNAAGTALCYETIVAHDLPVRRVVVASSQAVYGEGAVRCAKHGVVTPGPRSMDALAKADWDVRCPVCGADVESVPTPEEFANPRNSYGISKIAAEQATLALGETYGIESVALRYSIVHGPGQSVRNAYSGLLRSAALRMRERKAPVAFEDGKQLRDYVAIDDAVAATLLALDHPGAPGRAYNVGGGRAWTVLEVIDHLKEIAGVDVDPEISNAFRVGDVRHVVSDISRLQGLGWEPRANLDDVWHRYWAWLDEIAPPAQTVDDAYARMEREGVLRRAGS
ncbi:MAG: NAD-dependent epimerase/dehydratase family protein [Actinomycetota bacterium]|nr:NAD-dependent epimerase/dehydratase family protein [Actinomycetota bacterium]